jgi:hypothetical protein
VEVNVGFVGVRKKLVAVGELELLPGIRLQEASMIISRGIVK